MEDPIKKNTHDYLHAKIQIGNVKGPTSYQLNQIVFHHDDIPETKRKRKNEVKAWMKSKTLSIEIPKWNISAKPPGPVICRRSAENFKSDRTKAYQYNYRSETVDFLRMTEPIDLPSKFHISRQLERTALEINDIKSNNRIQRGYLSRTAEMPSHPKLVDVDPWNLSTEVNVIEKDKRLNTITNKSKEFTKKKNDLLLKDTYMSPIKLVNKLQNTIRQQKKDGTFSTSKHVNIDPIPPVDRSTLINRLAIEPKEKVQINYHSGVYEVSRIDGRSMWSDTGAEEYDSHGDMVRTINLGGLNLQGPDTSMSRYIGRKSSTAPVASYNNNNGGEIGKMGSITEEDSSVLTSLRG